MERIKHIVQLFETGLDSEDCVGYRGTSLESMEYIVNNGVLLGRLYGASREIYFFPFKSKFQNHPLRDTFPDEHDVIERTSQYAGQNAESHYLIRLLDLDIENAKDYVESLMLSEGDYFMDEILKKHPKLGFRRSNLLKIIHEAEKRKGFILGLNSKVLQSFKIMGSCDIKEGDLKIVCPNGLPYKYLSGIEPLGQEEWDYLVKIQNSIIQ